MNYATSIVGRDILKIRPSCCLPTTMGTYTDLMRDKTAMKDQELVLLSP